MVAGNTILVVDDSKLELEYVVSILKSENFTVLAAENAASAYQTLESNDIDLILLDIVLPGIDGFEICKQLKNNDETKDIPVIFITARTERENMIRGLQIGAVDFLTKPFNKEELLLRIKTRLQLRHVQVELQTQLENSKRIEADLKESNAQNEAVIEELTQFTEILNDANRKLEESEKRNEEIFNELNTVFDHAPIIMMLVDNNVRVENINHTGIELIGKSKEELQGSLSGQVFNCIHSFNQKEGCGKNAECLACPIRISVVETLATGKDCYKNEGKLNILVNNEVVTLTLFVSTSLIKINDTEKVLVSLDNITELKKAEQALLESETMFRSIFENSLSGIILFDKEGKNKACNTACMKTFGYTQEELMGFSVLKFIHPDDKIKVSNVFEQLKAKVLEFHTGEIRIVHQNGETVWINLNISNIYYQSSSEPQHILATFQDITQMKKDEQKLKELSATKDKFFSIIAHDLKNPFATILGFADILHKKYHQTEEEKRIKFVQYIYEGTRNLFRLLENLLMWSNSQTDRMICTPEKVDLKDLIDTDIQLFTETANQKSIQFESLVTESVFVWADPNMLSTVIRNLISNAIKFTRTNGKVMVQTQSRDHTVEISILDTGVGIKPENLNRLFKIETNFSSVGTERERGTGLGLILCREFVEKNGGEIWVESQEGVGSKFTFTLKMP